jgi:hypothetical protein
MGGAGEWQSLENGRRWRNLGAREYRGWRKIGPRNVGAEKSRVEVKRVWKASIVLSTFLQLWPLIWPLHFSGHAPNS